MANRLFPVLQFFESDGTPLAGGQIWTYETGGTSTPKETFQDSAGAASHANPIVLDTNGRPDGEGIWLETDVPYRFVVESTIGGTTKTFDGVVGLLNPLGGAYTSDSIQFKDGDGILDSNGNEVITIEKVASAVNYWNAINAATGNGVVWEAKGDNTNVDAIIKAKGTLGDMQFVTRGNTITLPTATPVDGQFISTDSSGQWSYGALTGLAAGQRQGSFLSNNTTDAEHDLDVSAGSRRDSSDTVTMVLASTMVKRIDAAWSAGTGNGGLSNSVALTANTWYHVHMIQDSGTGDTDVVFDTSITCTNGLADTGYEYYRYIGSILTDSSANILAFTQAGNYFIWNSPPLDLNSTTITTSRSAVTLSVPVDVKCLATLNGMMTNASATSVYLGAGDADDDAPSLSAAPLAQFYCGAGLSVQSTAEVLTTTANQIWARADNSSTTLRLATTGYTNFALDI